MTKLGTSGGGQSVAEVMRLPGEVTLIDTDSDDYSYCLLEPIKYTLRTCIMSIDIRDVTKPYEPTR